MVVYLSYLPETKTLMLQSPVRSDGGAPRGTLRRRLKAGDSYAGYTFEELLQLGNGKRELELDENGRKPQPASA